MKEKRALITGSSSGIGLGIAKHFCGLGMRVVVNSPFAREEDQTLKQLDKLGGSAFFQVADVSSRRGCEKLVSAARKQMGGIDILVNNAGIQHVSEVEKFPPEKWDAIIALNLSAAFHLTSLTVAEMKKNNWGRIINIASVHGLRASPFKAAYVAAKHGMLGLTKSVALELARTPVTCNAICPGYVRTPLVEKQIDDQQRVHKISREKVVEDIILAAQPTRRFIEVEDLAAFCGFLCSDNAQNITGSAHTMDGGWTAR